MKQRIEKCNHCHKDIAVVEGKFRRHPGTTPGQLCAGTYQKPEAYGSDDGRLAIWHAKNASGR